MRINARLDENRSQKLRYLTETTQRGVSDIIIGVGDKVFFNFNCVALDVMPVTIGSNTMFGSCVQIYTATHPMDWQVRAQGPEYAKPIRIGSHVWVGGGAIFCPGVAVGDRTVIGAGSVVTRDIPADVFAAGNPCRIIRQL